MMASSQHLSRAGDHLARKRLAQYARYAELVEAQEVALAADDLESFGDLALAIEAVQSEIGTTEPEAAGLVPGTSDAVEAVRMLEGAIATGERIRERLARDRKDGAVAIRVESSRRPHARQYFAEAKETPSSRLDMRL